MGSEVVHSGGCHCRRVRWQLEAPASVVAWICNCSDCSMRGNIHFVVPAAKFTLQAGCDEFITTYTFGTHTAKHKFCRICGIASFYIPRSNPDGVAVTVACVDPGTMAHVEYRKADGRNWEKWFALSDISEFSKDAATVKSIKPQRKGGGDYLIGLGPPGAIGAEEAPVLLDWPGRARGIRSMGDRPPEPEQPRSHLPKTLVEDSGGASKTTCGKQNNINKEGCVASTLAPAPFMVSTQA